MGDNLVYAVRGSTGLFLKRGLREDAQVLFNETEDTKRRPCEVMAFSNDGRLFAYCDNNITRVIDVSSGKDVVLAELPRTRAIVFSPKDTHMLTFQQYAIFGQRTSADQKPDPNLRIWNLKEGKNISTLIAQKEAVWQPQWTDDESMCVRLVGTELQVYRNNSFDRYQGRLAIPGIQCFSVSPGNSPPSIACYIAGSGSNPAKVQVRKINDEFTMLANKTFFKSDRAELIWNHKGTALLVISSVEVDTANLSYYGEQSVYMINIQNDESFMVPLSKKGPVYSVKWNPNGREFAVCYGYMPAKLTIYNTRGDVTFDAAEGPRNELHYNAFGNILLACGFGNIAKGKMEFWDTEKKKEIISIDVPNTTQFQWAPDGQHFITATTTPRLRIDNCYRLWNYSGKMIQELTYDSPREELWQVMFRPMSGYNKFDVRELTKSDKLQAGLLIKHKDASHPLNNLPAGAVKRTGAYVPPHLRKAAAATGNASSNGDSKGNTATAIKPQMTEAERRLFNLNKKIQDIAKLKERVGAGETLQKNQLDKINTEAVLLEELAKMKV